MMNVFVKVENMVGKEANAGYQHFLLFFPDNISKSLVKTGNCIVKRSTFFVRYTWPLLFHLQWTSYDNYAMEIEIFSV